MSLGVSLSLPLIISIIAFTLLITYNIQTSLFNYRVRKGFYGRNEYESREIIDFIVDNYKKVDFSDPGGPKKIISEEDLEKIQVYVKQRLATGVQPS